MFKKPHSFSNTVHYCRSSMPASLKRLVYYQGRINHCARRGWSPGARARRGPVIGCGDWLVIGSADRQSPPHPHLLALLFSGSFPYISFTFEFVFPIKCIYLIFCFWTTCVSIRRPLRPHSPLFASSGVIWKWSCTILKKKQCVRGAILIKIRREGKTTS